jgi:hypothetical protein
VEAPEASVKGSATEPAIWLARLFYPPGASGSLSENARSVHALQGSRPTVSPRVLRWTRASSLKGKCWYCEERTAMRLTSGFWLGLNAPREPEPCDKKCLRVAALDEMQ